MNRAFLLLAAPLLAAAPARAQDIVYTGTLHCGAVPAMNMPEINAQVTVTRQGDRLTFVRDFRTRGSGMGIRETATGTLAGNKATLIGGASVQGAGSSSTTLDTRLEAVLAGETITLNGTQTWTRRSGRAERPCSGSVRR